MHTIDTRNVEDLFGLWSVFSKCADSMEEGKRLENLSWRLWTRETFCCAPQPTPCISPRWDLRRRSERAPEKLPELSRTNSVESDLSSFDAQMEITALTSMSPARPELRRQDSTESHNHGSQKHINPSDLEKLVVSIKEKRDLEPLSPLQLPLAVKPPKMQVEDTTPRPSSPPPHIIPDSSTSTVATAHSDLSEISPAQGSETSQSDISTHSIVRGFALGRVSSSLRSKTQLAPQPTPILKNSPQHRVEPAVKKKGAMFLLGGSSGEGDESSLESRFMGGGRSSLTDGLRKPATDKKQTSFKDEVATRTIQDRAYESEEVFESDSDEDESESAIEDDEWEEYEDDPSGASSVNEKELFQRIDSRPNLTSRRSLLTTALTEKDRAAALQNAASRSTPAIRRSRLSSPNGPSTGNSPPSAVPEDIDETVMEMRGPHGSRSRPKPIIMTTSNTHDPPPALSPRTTRRNMLGTELTESLRKNLLWERQQKNSTSNAALAFKRRHTSNDLKNLQHYVGEPKVALTKALRENSSRNTNSWTNYFDTGLQEYHERGW